MTAASHLTAARAFWPLLLACIPLSGVRAATAPDLTLPASAVGADVVYTPDGDSAYDITLSGVGSGYDVSDTTYDGWCVEDNGKSTYFIVNLFSSYDSDMPLALQTYQDPAIPAVQSGDAALGDAVPWDKLNYLLNHQQGGMVDIQSAIWTLIWGSASTWGLTPTGAAMVDDAEANGAGFVPVAGQVIGVLLYVDGLGPEGIQETVIEVPVPDDGGCADADGDGYSTCARDCDDADPDVNPEAEEVCDGLDNDCDGAADEGLGGEGQSDLLVAYHDETGSLSVADSASGATTPLTNAGGAVSSGIQGVTTAAVNPADGLTYLASGEGDDSLYTLNPSTGEVHRIGALTGGASNLQAMDFAPANAASFGFAPGGLYGVSIDGFEGCGPNCLFRIDPATAEATPLGAIAANQIRGVSFNPVTGALWAYDPGGKALSILSADGTAAYQFTVPNSTQQDGTGVDTAFSLAHTCDGELYTVDIAYGVLLWIDLKTQQAYWVSDFGSAASGSGSFQGQGLDAMVDGTCPCTPVADGGGVTPDPVAGGGIAGSDDDPEDGGRWSAQAPGYRETYAGETADAATGCSLVPAGASSRSSLPALLLAASLWLERRRRGVRLPSNGRG